MSYTDEGRGTGAADPTPDPARRQNRDERPEAIPAWEDPAVTHMTDREDRTDDLARQEDPAVARTADVEPTPEAVPTPDPVRHEASTTTYRSDQAEPTDDPVRQDDPVRYDDPVRHDDPTTTHTAGEKAENVVHAVREEGHELADQARTELRNLTDDAREQLRRQAAEQSVKVSESLRRLGDQVSALAEGRPEESGPLSGYASSAAQELRHAAGRMQDRGFEGLVDDTRSFARNRPAAFLCIAAVAGFAAGRLLRGGTEAHKQHRDDDVKSADAAEYAPPTREEWPER